MKYRVCFQRRALMDLCFSHLMSSEDQLHRPDEQRWRQNGNMIVALKSYSAHPSQVYLRISEYGKAVISQGLDMIHRRAMQLTGVSIVLLFADSASLSNRHCEILEP